MLGLTRGLLFVAALAVLALLAGCKSDSNSGEPRETDQTQPTSTESPVDTLDIRSEDLAAQPELSEFLASTGGVLDSSRNQYADLTGSGAEEAVVSISSGGEGGDFAIIVFGYGADNEIEELLRAMAAETSILATIEKGQLKTTEGVFAPGDIGVPSQVLHRYYAWDGSALVIEREEQEPA